MKIKLLNNGGYRGLGDVSFPTEVKARAMSGGGFKVAGLELIRVGGDWEVFYPEYEYLFTTGEFEVLNCDVTPQLSEIPDFLVERMTP